MKFKPKLIFTILIFFGTLFSVNKQTNIVYADAEIMTEETDASTSDEKIIVTLPMYEVVHGANRYQLNDDNPMGLTAEMEVVDGVADYIDNINNGLFGIESGSVYSWSMPGWGMGARYDPETKKLYAAEQFEIDKIYYYLVRFTPKVNFIDPDGNNVGTAENQIVDVTTGGELLMSEEEATNPFDGRPGVKPPKGYFIDSENLPKHQPGDEISEIDIPVIKEDKYSFTVEQKIRGTATNGEYLINSNTYLVAVGELFEIKELSGNLKYNPQTSEENNNSLTLDAIGESGTLTDISYKDIQNFLLVMQSLPSNGQTNGANITLTIFYDDYDDETNPISYDVTIPSNLNSEQVPKVSVSGKKLGEKFEINVPAISGYKSDKAKVLAQVNADGTITTAEKVNYSKANSNNSHHSNNNLVNINDGITNFNSKLATTNTTDLYDINGNKINQTVASYKSFTTDKKLIKNNKTYYQVEPDKFVKAEDVYLYQDMQGNLRTYAGSYKYLINSQNKTVKNRALSAGSDWAADRIAKFGGQQYYRVATNEWVHVSDVFMYQPHVKVVEIVAGTSLYDERGNTIRSITGTISLKVDRKVTINNQQYYRVATNEYVLVSDIK